MPLQRFSDGLRSVPGLIVLNAGSMGDQPRLVIRGFYGGGETDYAAVLMDGVPLTSLSAGLANWDIIPIVAVRAIEVIPGSSSALYGEAALGGVINIITTLPDPISRALASDDRTVRHCRWKWRVERLAGRASGVALWRISSLRWIPRART